MSLLFGLLSPLNFLLPVILAVWYLRRHRDDAPGTGRTWLRTLCIVVLVLFVGGFGVCGAWGTVGGIGSLLTDSREARAYAPLFLGAGLIGLLLALGFAWLFRRLTRPTGRGPAAAGRGGNRQRDDDGGGGGDLNPFSATTRHDEPATSTTSSSSTTLATGAAVAAVATAAASAAGRGDGEPGPAGDGGGGRDSGGDTGGDAGGDSGGSSE